MILHRVPDYLECDDGNLHLENSDEDNDGIPDDAISDDNEDSVRILFDFMGNVIDDDRIPDHLDHSNDGDDDNDGIPDDSVSDAFAVNVEGFG